MVHIMSLPRLLVGRGLPLASNPLARYLSAAPPPPKPEKIECFIDGQKVLVDPGTTVLQVNRSKYVFLIHTAYMLSMRMSTLFKIVLKFPVQNNDRYCLACGSGRGDHYTRLIKVFSRYFDGSMFRCNFLIEQRNCEKT